METLPLEILGEIAGVSEESYRAMCLVRLFALQLNPGAITQWQIHFGYSVEITAEKIKWTRLGKKHRVGGPAEISTDGTQRWYYDGKLHRGISPEAKLRGENDDGPAEIYVNGVQLWYRRGIAHRDDGPAEIHPSGIKLWYCNGQLHRDDGPAMIWSRGKPQWYRHGVEIPQ